MSSTLSRLVAETHFSTTDWVIVAFYLCASVAIGVVVRKFVVSMSSYIGAGRAVGTALGVATLTGSEMGLVTVMYSAQTGFTSGFAAFHIALIAGIVTLLVGLSGFIIGPLRELQVLTIPEYYEKRFDKRTRVLGGFMLALGGILNMGLFLKVGSMFLVGITGLSSHGLALPIVMIVLLALVLLYTVLGGMLSVVLTDYVQFVVLSFGLLVTAGIAITTVGWDNIFSTVAQQKGEAGFDPFHESGDFGVSYVLWMVLTAGLVACAIWPTAVARALAASDVRTVKRQYMISSVSFAVRFLVPNFLGIAAFVYFHNQAPDLKAAFFPAEAGDGVNNLYALPIFLGRILPAGLIGLVTAAMIAAFMSTHDSYLLVWSSVITQDIIAPLSKKPMSSASRIRWTRIIIVLIGLYILYWGLLYEGRNEIWNYMAITGAVYFTGAIAVLCGGLYWKRASSTGAFLSLLAGLFMILALGPVQSLIGIDIGGDVIGLFTMAASSLAMVIGSLLAPDRPRAERETTDPRLATEEV